MLASAALAVVHAPLSAQTPPASNVVFAGYLQTQYNRITDESGDARDKIIFRRIIVGVEGTLGDDWAGEIQVDLAPPTMDERILIRDAYLRYNGFARRGLIVTAGNQKVPFSRSILTSSSRRSLVERPFTGDRAYGSSGRAISIRADGQNPSKSVQWSAALISAHHAPDADQIRISGLAEAHGDWNEGPMFAGRGEWHPFGPVPLDQGAFDVERLLITVAAGAYYWRNDGDNNQHTRDGRSTSSVLADLDDSLSIEISAGVRAPRLSLDAELQRSAAHAIDPTFTGGLYQLGDAWLLKASVETGWMLLPGRLEALGGIDTLDVDAYDALTWRPAAGLNWYFRRHRLKFQFMHRETVNANGVRGLRTRATYLQAQVVFTQ